MSRRYGKIDHTNTKCCVCGSSKSKLKYIDFEGKLVYHWNREYDNKGVWTSRYICDDCNYKLPEDYKRPVHKKNDIGTIGWLRQKLADKGVDTKNLNYNDLICLGQENKIFKSFIEVDRKRTKKIIDNAECRNISEYLDKCAQRRGFENNTDGVRQWRHNTGRNLAMSNNPDCPSYLGINFGERPIEKFLLIYFEHVRMTDYHDGGIDFVCVDPMQGLIDKYPKLKLERNKEYHIQLKTKCLRLRRKGRFGWDFVISYNNKSDYFILLGLDSKDNLNPLHIWMFHKDDIVREEIFWRRNSITITNTEEKLKEFDMHELIDELDILKEIIERLKEKN